MKFVRANMEDLDRLKAHYDYLIENTKDIAHNARWKIDVHPSRETINRYLMDDAVYMVMDGDTIAGSVGAPMYQGEDYHKVNWGIEAKDDEVISLHILGVNPDYQGKGVGKQLIEGAIQLAKDNGKKAVRLDTLTTNIPAQHMYEGRGMKCMGKQHLCLENTGWADFLYYEYIV